MSDRVIDTHVTYTLEQDGEFLLIEQVPARVCRETGEQYVSPETIEQIQATITSKSTPDKVIATPVYKFS